MRRRRDDRPPAPRRGKLREDRAVGPCIPVAAPGEIGQRPAHAGEFMDLAVDARDLSGDDVLDLAAGPAAIPPQCQQMAEIGHRETKPPGPADKGERRDIGL